MKPIAIALLLCITFIAIALIHEYRVDRREKDREFYRQLNQRSSYGLLGR